MSEYGQRVSFNISELAATAVSINAQKRSRNFSDVRRLNLV